MRRVSVIWVLIFALVWIALAAPRADAWVAGALAVAVGVALHTWLGGRQRIWLSARGMATFLPFFVAQAILGGVDVAQRALSPALRLDPGFLIYTVRLPPGASRIFFANCLSLLPGTLSARLEGRALTVHLLARDAEGLRRLASLERRVARLFGLDLEARGTIRTGRPDLGGAREGRADG